MGQSFFGHIVHPYFSFQRAQQLRAEIEAADPPPTYVEAESESDQTPTQTQFASPV